MDEKLFAYFLAHASVISAVSCLKDSQPPLGQWGDQIKCRLCARNRVRGSYRLFTQTGLSNVTMAVAGKCCNPHTVGGEKTRRG